MLPESIVRINDVKDFQRALQMIVLAELGLWLLGRYRWIELGSCKFVCKHVWSWRRLLLGCLLVVLLGLLALACLELV